MNLIKRIKEYFDESYEADISSLKSLSVEYDSAINAVPNKSTFETNPKFAPFKKDFEIKHNEFTRVILDNNKAIQEKIKSPSISISLTNSTKSLIELNEIIKSINNAIREHNDKLDQKEATLKRMRKTFWDIMRWEYDQTISSLLLDNNSFQKKESEIKKSLLALDAEKKQQETIISEQQKQTVNIEQAVSNINNQLILLGIDEFKIERHSEQLYKIVRGQNEDKIFHSLSEGEKMIISFLYFIEQCKGKKNSTDGVKKKIVVIDDPISSLSHVYIFNVGRLIHNEFLKGNNFEQIFVLTHSLYFFYELTETNHERRKENQKLFRITKNSTGSELLAMSYEEIQNDYHSYWYIVKDQNQPPALIANCMRNIIEYFFNFVEKKDLNNVFQKPSMQDNRFQAFSRYVNRESHSLGQNIFDIKEFNYNDFKDAFQLVFTENGYEEHYKKMIK